MSCCGCQANPPRITNLFRHQELMMKYQELTGLQIYSNIFICDSCVEVLERSYAFKEKCIEIYDGMNLPPFKKSEVIQDSDFFLPDDELIVYDGEEESIEGDPLVKEEEEFQVDAVFEEPNKVRYRNRYTNEQKIEIIRAAEVSSNKQAAKQFAVDESCIRKWRTQKHFHDKPSTSTAPVEFHDVKPIATETTTPKKTRKAYTAGRKLDVVNYAEVTGNRQAAKIFEIDESCIRKWRLNKEMLIEINRERGTKRKPNLHWSELEKSLKSWVIEKMNEGILLKPKEIRVRSLEIAKEMNVDNFRGTSSYIFKFMERYHIPGRQPKKEGKVKVKDELMQE